MSLSRLVFTAELFMKASLFFFCPPTVDKCHSRLQLWLIHFCYPCMPTESHHAPTPIRPILVKLKSWQQFVRFFIFSLHSAPTLILTQRWTDYILAATGLLWLHISPDACDIPGMSWGNFLKHNQHFPPQSSYGVRRSHRTWGPGLLWLPGLRNSWRARWAVRQWVTNCFRTSCWYHTDWDFPSVCLSSGWSADLRSPPLLSESGPSISNNKRASSPLPLPSALETGTKTAGQPHRY